MKKLHGKQIQYGTINQNHLNLTTPISGDTTSGATVEYVNSLTTHYHGEMYEYNTGGTNINLTNSDQFYGWISANQGNLENVGFSGNTTADRLVSIVTKDYHLGCQASFSGNANIIVTGAIFKNDVLQDNLVFVRKFGTTGDVGSASIMGIVYLNNGDYIDLRFSSDSNSKTISIQACNLNIE